MQILPDREQGRPLAIGLLVIALVLVYLVGFHWFVTRQLALGSEIDNLERQIARFKATAAQREELQERLQQLQRQRLDSALFLEGGDFNVAAAELIRTLREQIDARADDASVCQVTNTTPQRPRDPERFQSVRVSVRMQCPLPDFIRVLYELERAVPLIFIDNLMINQRASLSQRGRRGSDRYGQLDIRFEMFGYLDQPGEGFE
ncbi:type II secretion system protein GspM [Halomonas denitrificans]|nr:type II secretion system protein M [Halomonas denitrificans]